MAKEGTTPMCERMIKDIRTQKMGVRVRVRKQCRHQICLPNGGLAETLA